MAEVNLLDSYPRSNRPIEQRAATVTEADRAVARRFGKEYFDGDRLTGYGGYSYHPRFWTETVKRFAGYYRLSAAASVLDVGCAKGFMLYDFHQAFPSMVLRGIDVSSYAIENAHPGMAPYLAVGSAVQLPYPDRSFDLVISINTIHNLSLHDCEAALREIQRVSRGNSFIVVDAYRNEQERTRLEQWNLTALTYMHVDEWREVFERVGYTGDYFWFIAE
jgi:SAM-dependent methyltransferase